MESKKPENVVDEENFNKLVEHLRRIGALEMTCPVCGKTGKWECDGNIFEMRKFNKGALGGGPIIPCYVMIHECGYSVLFNAIKVGAVTNEPGKD